MQCKLLDFFVFSHFLPSRRGEICIAPRRTGIDPHSRQAPMTFEPQRMEKNHVDRAFSFSSPPIAARVFTFLLYERLVKANVRTNYDSTSPVAATRSRNMCIHAEIYLTFITCDAASGQRLTTKGNFASKMN